MFAVFSWLFGTEKNKPLLKGLLENVFHKNIEQIEFINIEHRPLSPEGRSAFFYTVFPIMEQAPQGYWNYELKPVYFLGLLNFKLAKSVGRSDGFVHRFSIRNAETGAEMTDRLQFVLMEVGPFRKRLGECSSFEDKFLYFMKNLPTFAARPRTDNDAYFESLLSAAEIARMNTDIRFTYSRRLKEMRDARCVDDYMKKTAREEGLAEGRAEGLAEGRQAIARKMLEEGMEAEMIERLTGLSREEIEALV
ncbi:MAG: PD-(D/E)XK nuclease family transposase [Bacteroidales bacterium]|nr:PD-(D/E)XK nuclease family transposase [Bacteroidales bacterium]